VGFEFGPPTPQGALLQGDLLSGVVEYRVIDTSDAKKPLVKPFPRPFCVVISASCDLFFDFRQRSDPEEGKEHKLLEAIWLTLLFEKRQIHDLGIQGSDWNAIKSKHRSRFHLLDGPSSEPRLPVLLADFKRSFGIAPETIYDQVKQGQVKKLGSIPNVYLHDLMQRCYSFLGRVSTPD
jgi:hypothetical protein